MTDTLSKNLKRLAEPIKTDRLNTLEAKVWQAIGSQTDTSPTFGSIMMLRAASIALVLFVGGLVGASQKSADPVLMAFSSAPAYSVMSMIKN